MADGCCSGLLRASWPAWTIQQRAFPRPHQLPGCRVVAIGVISPSCSYQGPRLSQHGSGTSDRGSKPVVFVPLPTCAVNAPDLSNCSLGVPSVVAVGSPSSVETGAEPLDITMGGVQVQARRAGAATGREACTCLCAVELLPPACLPAHPLTHPLTEAPLRGTMDTTAPPQNSEWPANTRW